MPVMKITLLEPVICITYLLPMNVRASSRMSDHRGFLFFCAFGSRYYRKKVTNFLVANPGYVKPSMRPQTTKEVANTPETGTMTEDISFVAKNAEIPKDTKDGRATSRANGKKKRKSPSKSSSSSRSGSRSSRSSSSSSTSSRSSKSSRNGPHSPLSPVSPVQPGDDPFK